MAGRCTDQGPSRLATAAGEYTASRLVSALLTIDRSPLGGVAGTLGHGARLARDTVVDSPLGAAVHAVGAGKGSVETAAWGILGAMVHLPGMRYVGSAARLLRAVAVVVAVAAGDLVRAFAALKVAIVKELERGAAHVIAW